MVLAEYKIDGKVFKHFHVKLLDNNQQRPAINHWSLNKPKQAYAPKSARRLANQGEEPTHFLTVSYTKLSSHDNEQENPEIWVPYHKQNKIAYLRKTWTEAKKQAIRRYLTEDEASGLVDHVVELNP